MATESHTAEEIERHVIRVIAETQRIEPGKITPSSTFEELGIDSFDGINVLFALETEFEIRISDDEAKGLRSVAQVIEGVEGLVAQKRVPKPA
jgi:acyl carrier protein